jgi:hypothetical protein
MSPRRDEMTTRDVGVDVGRETKGSRSEPISARVAVGWPSVYRRVMSEVVNGYRKAVVARVLDGNGTASAAQRRAAFDNTNVAESARGLIDKVARNAWKVADEDVAAAKAAGLSEDEIFELVVCAAVGQSTRQLDAALAALDEATKKGA